MISITTGATFTEESFLVTRNIRKCTELPEKEQDALITYLINQHIDHNWNLKFKTLGEVLTTAGFTHRVLPSECQHAYDVLALTDTFLESTELFKSLVEALPHRRERFLVDLRVAGKRLRERGTRIGWNDTDLDGAFVWVHTPQGHNYWSEIHRLITAEKDRIRQAKIAAELEYAKRVEAAKEEEKNELIAWALAHAPKAPAGYRISGFRVPAGNETYLSLLVRDVIIASVPVLEHDSVLEDAPARLKSVKLLGYRFCLEKDEPKTLRLVVDLTEDEATWLHSLTGRIGGSSTIPARRAVDKVYAKLQEIRGQTVVFPSPFDFSTDRGRFHEVYLEPV